jgi:hypothetical protein
MLSKPSSHACSNTTVPFSFNVLDYRSTRALLSVHIDLDATAGWDAAWVTEPLEMVETAAPKSENLVDARRIAPRRLPTRFDPVGAKKRKLLTSSVILDYAVKLSVTDAKTP